MIGAVLPFSPSHHASFGTLPIAGRLSVGRRACPSPLSLWTKELYHSTQIRIYENEGSDEYVIKNRIINSPEHGRLRRRQEGQQRPDRRGELAILQDHGRKQWGERFRAIQGKAHALLQQGLRVFFADKRLGAEEKEREKARQVHETEAKSRNQKGGQD